MMHACEGDRRKQPLIFHISLANAFTLAARAGLPRERISPPALAGAKLGSKAHWPQATFGCYVVSFTLKTK